MSYKGPVAFRPPIARGLAFHRKTNFNIIKTIYANTMRKQKVFKYILVIQIVGRGNL